VADSVDQEDKADRVKVDDEAVAKEPTLLLPRFKINWKPGSQERRQDAAFLHFIEFELPAT
jgi:hypothetical protein